MSIIKHVREENITEDGIVILETRIYFLGIPIYQNICYTTSLAAIYQFTESDNKPVTGYYDVNNIGFKHNES